MLFSPYCCFTKLPHIYSCNYKLLHSSFWRSEPQFASVFSSGSTHFLYIFVPKKVPQEGIRLENVQEKPLFKKKHYHFKQRKRKECYLLQCVLSVKPQISNSIWHGLDNFTLHRGVGTDTQMELVTVFTSRVLNNSSLLFLTF